MSDPVSVMSALFLVIIFGGLLLALASVLWLQMKRIDRIMIHKPTYKQKIGKYRALEESDFIKIRAMLDNGDTKTEIAESFGVSRPTLYKFLKRMRKK